MENEKFLQGNSYDNCQAITRIKAKDICRSYLVSIIEKSERINHRGIEDCIQSSIQSLMKY